MKTWPYERKRPRHGIQGIAVLRHVLEDVVHQDQIKCGLGRQIRDVSTFESELRIRHERRRVDDVRAELEPQGAPYKTRLAQRVEHAALMGPEVTDVRPAKLQPLGEPRQDHVAAHAALVVEIREVLQESIPGLRTRLRGHGGTLTADQAGRPDNTWPGVRPQFRA